MPRRQSDPAIPSGAKVTGCCVPAPLTPPTPLSSPFTETRRRRAHKSPARGSHSSVTKPMWVPRHPHHTASNRGCLMIMCMATFHSPSQDIKHSGVADKDHKNSSGYQRLQGPHHLSIWSTTAESWGHTRAPLLSDSASSPALCRKQTYSQILWESPVLGEDTQLLTWIFSLLRS